MSDKLKTPEEEFADSESLRLDLEGSDKVLKNGDAVKLPGCFESWVRKYGEARTNMHSARTTLLDSMEGHMSSYDPSQIKHYRDRFKELEEFDFLVADICRAIKEAKDDYLKSVGYETKVIDTWEDEDMSQYTIDSNGVFYTPKHIKEEKDN